MVTHVKECTAILAVTVCKMKGIEKIKAFLNSGKPQSAMQKDLSHLQVDREAILQVLWDQHQNLKARTDVQTTEQPRAPTPDAAEEGEKNKF